MENFMTFDTNSLLFFLAALPVLVSAFIIINKYLIKRIKHNFDFNSGYYLMGLAISISTSIALLNWETYDQPIDYFVYPDLEDPAIVNVPRTFQREIVRAVPPPPKQKKITKAIDLTKLKLIKNDVVAEQKELVVEQVETPSPPVEVVEAAPPPMPEPIVEEKDPEFVFVAEQMPRFPGCEHLEAGMLEKESCSKQELMGYIYKHLKYPPLARGNSIEGLVVLQFVVSKEGRIENLKVVRDIGGGCGAAAAKVVASMNEMEQPWTAGKQRGRPVKVLYTLPVKFRLN